MQMYVRVVSEFNNDDYDHDDDDDVVTTHTSNIWSSHAIGALVVLRTKLN